MALLHLALVSIQRESDGDVQAVLEEALRIALSIVSLPIGQGGLDVTAALGAHRDERARRVPGDASFAGAEMRGRATGYAKALAAARGWLVSRSGRAASD